MDGSLFLMRDRGFHLGPGLETSRHSVHGVKVYIAVHGAFQVRTDHSPVWRTLRSVVIAPDQPHQVDGRGAMLATFLLIPETAVARRAAPLVPQRGAVILEADDLSAVLPRLQIYLRHGCTNAEAVEVCDDLFHTLLPPHLPSVGLDRRVARALEHIHCAKDYRLPLEEISRAVSLSATRLSHLFKEQTGTTVNHYLLWRRLRAALDEMAISTSLTQVAHSAGFADSAHLSRTFRRMFGQAPSALFKHSRIIRTGL